MIACRHHDRAFDFGPSTGKRKAYTLLELLLSLALTVIVIAGITMAINLYYQTLTRQQRRIEQDLVGRAVLTMVANDLRAALQYKAADVSGIENLAASQALIAGLGGGAGAAGGGSATGDEAGEDTESGDDSSGDGGSGDGGSGGGASTDGSGAGATAGTADAAEEENPAEQDNAWYRPAFIGGANQLTVDISRLPRLDQYSQLTQGLEATSTPSDIKRIAWLVSLDGTPADPDSLDPAGDSAGGLYRREVDRAAAAFRKDPDSPSGPDEYSKLIAPEVVSMQFRYFDGSQWKAAWDSESDGGFPLAVEVILLVDGGRGFSGGQRGAASTSINEDNLQPYRLVVNLPSAEILPEEEEE